MKKFFTLIFATLMSMSMFGENVIAGLKAPEANCPANVSLCVMPSPDEGDLFEMEFNTGTGWYVAYEAQANENDMFKFVDFNNPRLVLCKYENNEWIQAVIKFADVWWDDSWKGNPVKWLELDFSNPNLYAWLENMPDLSSINALTAKTNVKVAKIMRNGKVLIVRGGKTYNVMGTEVR